MNRQTGEYLSASVVFACVMFLSNFVLSAVAGPNLEGPSAKSRAAVPPAQESASQTHPVPAGITINIDSAEVRMQRQPAAPSTDKPDELGSVHLLVHVSKFSNTHHIPS